MTAQRYCDEIITPVVIPFLQQQPGFLFQHTAMLPTNLLEWNTTSKCWTGHLSPLTCPQLSKHWTYWAVGYAKTILISLMPVTYKFRWTGNITQILFLRLMVSLEAWDDDAHTHYWPSQHFDVSSVDLKVTTLTPWLTRLTRLRRYTRYRILWS